MIAIRDGGEMSDSDSSSDSETESSPAQDYWLAVVLEKAGYVGKKATGSALCVHGVQVQRDDTYIRIRWMTASEDQVSEGGGREFNDSGLPPCVWLYPRSIIRKKIGKVDAQKKYILTNAQHYSIMGELAIPTAAGIFPHAAGLADSI